MIVSTSDIRLCLALVLSLLGLASGCHGPHGGWCRQHCGQYFGGPLPVCFGHSSTCWHPWPAECVTCPTPFSPEGLESPHYGKSLPEPAVQPAYEPPVPMPQAIEPAIPPESSPRLPAPLPSTLQPPAPQLPAPQPPAPHQEEQSLYEPPPPVLTAAPIVTPASLRKPQVLGADAP